jgi:hypothetical protein
MSFSSQPFMVVRSFVVMAEVVYDPGLFAPLVSTLLQLHREQTTLLLGISSSTPCLTFVKGYEWRHKSDSGFFAKLQQHFTLEKVPEALYYGEPIATASDAAIRPREDLCIYRLRLQQSVAALGVPDFGPGNHRLLYWWCLRHMDRPTAIALIADPPRQLAPLPDFGAGNNRLLYWYLLRS